MRCSPQLPLSRRPTRFIASTCSGHWSMSVTSCPAFVSRPPTMEPMAPAPRMPILMRSLPCRPPLRPWSAPWHHPAPPHCRQASGGVMGAFDDYEQFDGVGLAELVRRGKVTPTQLLEAAI